MKFLYSHRTRSADGQYVHIRHLTEALHARGHEIIMAGPDNEAVASKNLDAGQNSGGLKTMMPRAMYECAEFGYSFAGYRRLKHKAAMSAPDILYERYNLFYHAGLWAKKNLNLPMILEVNAPLVDERMRHGGLALRGLARRSEHAIWNSADMVLPVTNALADHVRAAGVHEDRIQIIQNGVSEDFLTDIDPAPIRERYNLQGKLVLGFTGFVRDWHGVDRVLHFIADAKDKNLHLLLVGDGPARVGLEELADELGIRNQLTVTGVVQREDMVAHVEAIDIALQPAVTAYASPLKLFEYMARGKPIIAPASANICEVLTDNTDALLFNDSDERAFVDALARLFKDQDLRARIGIGARETLTRKDYTWAGNARHVEKIAERLMGKST